MVVSNATKASATYSAAGGGLIGVALCRSNGPAFQWTSHGGYETHADAYAVADSMCANLNRIAAQNGSFTDADVQRIYISADQAFWGAR